jgi:ferric-dicitrate binding protein FerR (iron transport regulator)
MTDAPEHLILKYLQGTLTPDQKNMFQSWLDESDEHRKMVSDFRAIWQLSEASETRLDIDKAREFKRIQDALVIDDPARTRPKSWSYFLRIAAAIVFILVCPLVLYTLFFRNDIIIHETSSDIKEIELPDGSKAWLNSHSSLKYATDFSNKRRLSLEGEGFFEVKPDPQKPFIIQAHKAEVKVLGTSFNVKALEKDILAEVFVVTGKVSLSSTETNTSITLLPGSHGLFNKNDLTLSVDAQPPPNITAWKDRALVFNKTPLREVVRSLENYFRVKIVVNNKNLLDCRFTGTFNEAPLEDVIEAVAVALDLQVEREANSISIFGEGCN